MAGAAYWGEVRGLQLADLGRSRGRDAAFRLQFVAAFARADIFDYIETFYNRIRRHSHLGGVSPEAFERASL
jgi:hypothetical protein